MPAPDLQKLGHICDDKNKPIFAVMECTNSNFGEHPSEVKAKCNEALEISKKNNQVPCDAYFSIVKPMDVPSFVNNLSKDGKCEGRKDDERLHLFNNMYSRVLLRYEVDWMSNKHRGGDCCVTHTNCRSGKCVTNVHGNQECGCENDDVCGLNRHCVNGICETRQTS